MTLTSDIVRLASQMAEHRVPEITARLIRSRNKRAGWDVRVLYSRPDQQPIPETLATTLTGMSEKLSEDLMKVSLSPRMEYEEFITWFKPSARPIGYVRLGQIPSERIMSQ